MESPPPETATNKWLPRGSGHSRCSTLRASVTAVGGCDGGTHGFSPEPERTPS